MPRPNGYSRRDPLTAEQQALAVAHLPVAFVRARWWSRIHPELLDEIRSEAQWALCLAASNFDPDRGGWGFGRFAARRIDMQIRDFLRFLAKRPGCGHLATQACGVELEAPDRGPSAEATIDGRDELDRVLAVLDERTRLIIEREAAGESLFGIAGSLGVTKQAAHQARDRGLRKLRERFPGKSS